MYSNEIKLCKSVKEVKELMKLVEKWLTPDFHCSAKFYNHMMYILNGDRERAREHARKLAGGIQYKAVINNQEYIIKANNLDGAEKYVKSNFEWYGANIVEVDSEGESIPYGDFSCLPKRDFFDLQNEWMSYKT
jgi:uncharacterized protein YacL (UPF0231 family)